MGHAKESSQGYADADCVCGTHTACVRCQTDTGMPVMFRLYDVRVRLRRERTLARKRQRVGRIGGGKVTSMSERHPVKSSRGLRTPIPDSPSLFVCVRMCVPVCSVCLCAHALALPKADAGAESGSGGGLQPPPPRRAAGGGGGGDGKPSRKRLMRDLYPEVEGGPASGAVSRGAGAGEGESWGISGSRGGGVMGVF